MTVTCSVTVLVSRRIDCVFVCVRACVCVGGGAYVFLLSESLPEYDYFLNVDERS